MKKLTTIGIFLGLALVTLRAQDAPVTNIEPDTNKLDMVEILKSPQMFTNSVGMEMIPVGGLWAGKYEVTQDVYKKIMGANPSHFSGATNPVDSVSWNNAIDFCKR